MAGLWPTVLPIAAAEMSLRAWVLRGGVDRFVSVIFLVVLDASVAPLLSGRLFVSASIWSIERSSQPFWTLTMAKLSRVRIAAASFSESDMQAGKTATWRLRELKDGILFSGPYI